MEEKKASKLHEIRETASDAVEIMRQISTPGVLESLDNVKETAAIVNEIIQGLKTPEMVKNIENFRLISENMNGAASKIQNTMQQLKETGVIDKTSDLIHTAKEKIDSFGHGDENSINGHDLRDVSVATREMFVSIKDLMNELTATITSSKKSGAIRNIQETIKEASDIRKTVTSVI
ncbi:MAG: hypothetical protein HW410_1226 [Nitrosarchaeum sp.]|nr:hypothetical protein [Nitrosarchaeum sp.]